MNHWNDKLLAQKKKEGKIQDYHIAPKKKRTPGMPRIEKKSAEKEWLHWNLLMWGYEKALILATEYQFDEVRLWRFDFAFEAVKLAIEYEGLFSEKSRHTTVQGFNGDIEKYTAAALQGWQVIRVTAVNYKTTLQLCEQFLKLYYEMQKRS